MCRTTNFMSNIPQFLNKANSIYEEIPRIANANLHCAQKISYYWQFRQVDKITVHTMPGIVQYPYLWNIEKQERKKKKEMEERLTRLPISSSMGEERPTVEHLLSSTRLHSKFIVFENARGEESAHHACKVKVISFFRQYLLINWTNQLSRRRTNHKSQTTYSRFVHTFTCKWR